METKSPFSIDSNFEVDVHCWRHNNNIATIKNVLKKTCIAGLEPWTLWNNGGFSLYRSPVEEPSLLSTFKNKLYLPQRHSIHFEQVPFQLVLTRLSYQRNADGQTAFQLYIVDCLLLLWMALIYLLTNGLYINSTCTLKQVS